MEDVTFGRNGRDAERPLQHSATLINYMRDPESDVYVTSECNTHFQMYIVLSCVRQMYQ